MSDKKLIGMRDVKDEEGPSIKSLDDYICLILISTTGDAYSRDGNDGIQITVIFVSF
jgi:hypothetical protein